MRIGIGYDVHKLVEDRKLIIGGIELEYDILMQTYLFTQLWMPF